MASATITTQNHAGGNKVFSLAGVRQNGALYKDATRSLGLPLTMEFKYILGTPGAKGNDRLSIIVSNSVQNATSGQIFTGQAKIEVSIPRDTAWADGASEDIINYVGYVLSASANRASVADAIVP